MYLKQKYYLHNDSMLYLLDTSFHKQPAAEFGQMHQKQLFIFDMQRRN